jgi:UDP-glucose 4-epimerase
MAILVTGGGGYIGSVVVEVLRERGVAVVVVDNLSRGHRAAVAEDVPFYVGDVTDGPFLRNVFRDHAIDGVFHFAAWSLVGDSMRNAGEYFRNNVGGLLGLLGVMLEAGTSRFVLSSTAATYGEPTAVPIPETAPTVPTNPYGESKLACERILHWMGVVHGLRWASLRYFNAAGASERCGEDHTPETHLVPLAIAAAAGRRGPLPVFGLDYPTPDGSCVRDYVHVEDLAEAHLLALEHMSERPAEIYNLGNGEGFSVLEVLSAVHRATGRPVPWEAAPRRSGDPARLVASSDKARRDLGWTPRRDRLEVIVESAWRWAQAHPRGYAPPHGDAARS